MIDYKECLSRCKWIITLVGNSNDPPRKYCILDVIKRLKNQSRLVKTGQTWSKLVKTGWNWSKLSKLVKTCNGLPCSKTNRTFIWTFRNLIFFFYLTLHIMGHIPYLMQVWKFWIFPPLIFPRGCRPVCYWTPEGAC